MLQAMGGLSRPASGSHRISTPACPSRYARAVYEAAALAVGAVLERLAVEGFYRRAELEEALAVVVKAASELPNSMVRPGFGGALRGTACCPAVSECGD